jgi:alpha-tubulin suppressor-like RCC1 family protein
LGHDLAVLSNGTVVAWGLTNLYPTTTNALAYQTNLTGVKAVACGWNHNVALLSNGLVRAWGLNAASLGWNLTNVPAGLTNAVAISAFGLHSMALLSNGTVAA